MMMAAREESLRRFVCIPLKIENLEFRKLFLFQCIVRVLGVKKKAIASVIRDAGVFFT
jgi:hypothetical protein